MNELTMISIDELYQHPKNPRQDIGDIEELTKSVIINGIMQNLTVVPGHWETTTEYDDEGYTIIIGHRRYAAAKAAGLTEVPCRIAELDYKEQITTMLEENIQRSDLTICEQAESFQLMMDLGDTEQDLVDKTGFSKTTVRHRLNLAKLDKKLLREKEENKAFQLSFTDLYELEKIKDINKRNEILEKAVNSRDLEWRISSAVKREKREALNKKIIEALEEKGIKECEDLEGYQYFSTIKTKDDTFEISEEDITEDCAYSINFYNEIDIVIPNTDDYEESEENKKSRERIEKCAEARKIKENLNGRVKEFVREVVDGELSDIKITLELCEELFNKIMAGNGMAYFSNSLIVKYLRGKDQYNTPKEEFEEECNRITRMPLHHKLMVMLADRADNVTSIMNYDNERDEYNADICISMYETLKEWGFSLEDEEIKLLDGTSELYK